MTARRQSRRAPTERGRAAEKRAEQWLRARGFTTVERNHRNRAGEIDLVVREGETLCFVEVRLRSRAEFGGAVATVDGKKQHRLRRAAALFLALKPWHGPCRFDVVTLDRTCDGWRIEHYPDAF